jgi:ComF family protein
LLPGGCALCGGDGPGPLCASCCHRLLQQDVQRCMRCAMRWAAPSISPDHKGDTCPACTRNPPSFDRTLVLADYSPPIDRLLQGLKFRAQLPLATAVGSLLARAAASLPAGDAIAAALTRTPPPVLLPVPLSRERLSERGFNQAHEIARPLARSLRLKIAGSLCARIRHTDAQASLTMAERQVNMRGAFAVLQRQAIAGKTVFVIDDVMTTGHTLEAMAACLKRHGAAHVFNFVIARTPAR